MKSLSLRCPFCGNDNLFPAKYAGRTLSCAHCGDPLTLPAVGGTKVTAVPLDRELSAARETGLRRLMRAICYGLCVLCAVVLGVIGGGWGGAELAFRWGVLGYLLTLIACPVGALVGGLVGRWLGRGLGRLMSSYRLTLPGLLAGWGGGLLYWSQSAQSSLDRLLAATLNFQEWVSLSLVLAAAGLLAGLAAMLVDATFNFTR